MSLQPPLELGLSGPGLCSRATGPNPEGGDRCTNEATWHVIWKLDPEMTNGLCCDEHMDEARELWVFYAAHKYVQSFCSHPNAMFQHDLNDCVIPIDDYPRVLMEEADAKTKTAGQS